MKVNSFLARVLQGFFDSIEEIVSLIIAGQVVYVEIVAPNTLSLEGLTARILAIVTLLALSNLRDRFYRLRRINELINVISTKLDAKVFDPIRAENLIRDDHDPSPSFLNNANEVCISGITLVRTVGKYHEALYNKVVQGARVRIILLDSSSKDAISQLELRSWGVVPKNYYENRLAATSSQIEVIGENIKTSSNTFGSLEIGYLPFVPSFGIIAIDPQDITNGKAWIQIYHHLTDDPNPGMEIDRVRDRKWFDFFSEQFEKMWSLSRVKKIV